MMRLRLAVLLPALALMVGTVSAGWQFECVDSVGAPVAVQARRLPDGRLCLCYGGATIGLRYAYKDTIWHFEDIGPDSGGFGFSVSPAGVPAVLSGSTCIERTDTGWARTTVPLPPHYPYLTHDSAGSPVYLRFASAPDTQMLIAVSRVDSVWVQDTAVLLVMPDEGLGAGGLRQDVFGRPVVLFGYYIISGALSYQCLNVATRTDSGWMREGAGSTLDGYFATSALGVDASGRWGVASVVTGYLIDYWLAYAGAGGGGYIVRAQSWTRLAVVVDSRVRPQIVYLRNEHPMLAWKDSSAWDTLRIPWSDWVGAIDIVTSDRDEPIIAMSTRNGVWLARADRVLGCGAEPGPTAVSNRAGSVCRGILNLAPALCRPGSPVALLDALGRRALDLHPGANDVSCLVPGVYYVRGSAPGAVTKVVVTR